jgi:O-acetyl-ADP-ribose deacetylase (regulator of RNase III)
VPIEVVKADIMTLAVDAIVNAANESLLAGGGVCGAIHRAAGPEMELACRVLAPCPTGQAVITPGFRLHARYVIHAVGPRWLGGTRDEEQLLRSCYQSLFQLVDTHHINSVAIPAISTGIYHYPVGAATHVAFNTAKAFLSKAHNVTVLFVCFDDQTHQVYQEEKAQKC